MSQFQQIIACVPTDTRLIKFINDAMAAEGNPPFVPSIEHSISHCQRCQQSVWIGPTQKQMADSVLFHTLVLCSICITSDVTLRPSLYSPAVSVNPDIDQVPKRY